MNEILKPTKVKGKDVECPTKEDVNMIEIFNDDVEEPGKDEGNREEATSKTEEREHEVKHERDNAKKYEKKIKTKHQRRTLSLRKSLIIRSRGVEDTGTPKYASHCIKFGGTTTTTTTIGANRQRTYHGLRFNGTIG